MHYNRLPHINREAPADPSFYRYRLALKLLLSVQVAGCWARSYRDVKLMHSMSEPDILGQLYLQEKEMFYLSDRPVLNLLSSSPAVRYSTTNAPSPMPSRASTQRPTQQPTTSPSLSPTVTPSFSPSVVPTSSPSILPNVGDPYPPSDAPLNPEPWYYNYNTSIGAKYGPGLVGLVAHHDSGHFDTGMRNEHWGRVGPPPDNYWTEFTDEGFGPWKSVLQIHGPAQNQCSGGELQSPIDLRENGSLCQEHHEVRSLPGDFQVIGQYVEKRIEPGKLRLVYPRRPCSNLSLKACQEPDPPAADFPNNFPGLVDVVHVDLKIPSEHTITGERFDAEMQIFHIHPGRRRLVAQSVLIRASPDRYNYMLQEALNAFQKQYDENRAQCRGRSLASNLTSPYDDFETWARGWGTTTFQPPFRQFEGNAWDPHNEILIPSIYFYRYDGSLTEPPCGEFVTWFVADEPMVISLEQLEQLKNILFTNVDGNCQKTSVQYKHSVARPIQLTRNRPVTKCTSLDFGPDTR